MFSPSPKSTTNLGFAVRTAKLTSTNTVSPTWRCRDALARSWVGSGEQESRREGTCCQLPPCQSLLRSSHPFPCFFFFSPCLQEGVSTHGRDGVLGPTLLSLMLFPHPVLPYSPLVSVGPIAPHSTATSSTLVSKISVSAPHGTWGNGLSLELVLAPPLDLETKS